MMSISKVATLVRCGVKGVEHLLHCGVELSERLKYGYSHTLMAVASLYVAFIPGFCLDVLTPMGMIAVIWIYEDIVRILRLTVPSLGVVVYTVFM